MTTDTLEQFSDALADRLADAASFTVAVRTGRRDRSGILWRDDVVVTSEQVLPEGTDFSVVHSGVETPAHLAGRDPGTNVAVLRLTQGLGAQPSGNQRRRRGWAHLSCSLAPTRQERRPGGSAWCMRPVRRGTAWRAGASMRCCGSMRGSAPMRAARF